MYVKTSRLIGLSIQCVVGLLWLSIGSGVYGTVMSIVDKGFTYLYTPLINSLQNGSYILLLWLGLYLFLPVLFVTHYVFTYLLYTLVRLEGSIEMGSKEALQSLLYPVYMAIFWTVLSALVFVYGGLILSWTYPGIALLGVVAITMVVSTSSSYVLACVFHINNKQREKD